MIARLFFKQAIKRRCGPFWRQRKIENIREMTTKIDTKCGLESKMLSGILNGGAESPQVRVKIQTVLAPIQIGCIFLWATRDYTM